jgi:transcriptional regulator with GAF, ATPase, and Fis domain
MMENGEFRQDLYYRISAFPIQLPPLRNRVEDIGLLANSFLQRAGTGKRRLTIEAEALTQLQRHSWPGNIRELRNVLERASLFADDGVIRSTHLPQASVAISPQPPLQRLSTAARWHRHWRRSKAPAVNWPGTWASANVRCTDD